ncbi:uncharacterized protein JCM10292_000358 [Rhodotorula paludigena]|uniref:uncharacterized protein n=1 Tax=Rhodotorula paludigena TaxID=86838 RepID=UPI003174FAFD
MPASLGQVPVLAGQSSRTTSAVGEPQPHDSAPSTKDSETDSDAPDPGKDDSEAPEKLETSARSVTSFDVGATALAKKPEIPWAVKGPVLAMVIFFEVAVYWNSGLGSIKATIRNKLGINNAQYGVIQSAQSLVNTVVPFFSGAIMDYYGAEISSVVCSTLIFVGYLLAAIGATIESYPLVVVGEVLAGFGDITVRTSQIKITSHWFAGTHLGLVLGLAISVQRTIGVISKATAVPIARHSGYHMFFWVALILQAAALAVNVLYFLYERRVPAQFRAVTGRALAAQAKRSGDSTRTGGIKLGFRRFWRSVWLLPAFFWLLILTQMLQNGVVISFQGLSADMVRVTRGTTEKAAGWISAVGQIPVIILTPLTGVFFDRIGFRVHFIALSALGWIAIFCLLGFSRLNPIAVTMLQSLPYAINLIPLQAVIALSVSPLQQGSAQGTYQALVNAGTVIVSVCSGAIQDISPKGRKNYNNVLIFMLAIKAFDVAAGGLYCLLDLTSLDKILSRSNAQQRAYNDKVHAGELEPAQTPMLEPKRGWTRAALVIILAQCIVAWVVFLKYSV